MPRKKAAPPDSPVSESAPYRTELRVHLTHRAALVHPFDDGEAPPVRVVWHNATPHLPEITAPMFGGSSPDDAEQFADAIRHAATVARAFAAATPAGADA
jgi:hypothetical protein